ncbi:ADP-ribosyl-(dinitrogen reductase) hydrolase [Gammaproteobacteria bacterium]
MNKLSSIQGVLIGTAVGDALGLPLEGLSRRRALIWYPRLEYPALIFRRFGLCSDDTEHNALLAQALLYCRGQPDRFQRRLAWGLRLWFSSLPAGVGMATARACIKLCCGYPLRWCGVYSAGNGPAMRVALLGLVFSEQPDQLKAFVRASTRLTHTDPKAEAAALAIAFAVHWGCSHVELNGRNFLAALQPLLADNDPSELPRLLEDMVESIESGESTVDYAQHLCGPSGVSGYAYHSVPVVLHAWLKYGDDFRAGLTAALRCGGDTDTIGAMLGALLGSRLGVEQIPLAWRGHLIDWPRSQSWLMALSEQVTNSVPGFALPPVRRFSLWYFALTWPVYLLRNFIFLVIVLLHAVRRLAPPY